MKSKTKIPPTYYIGMQSSDDFTAMKDVVMSRFNIKKSKRVHISTMMDELLKLMIKKGEVNVSIPDEPVLADIDRLVNEINEIVDES